jgi:hypothetical protein
VALLVVRARTASAWASLMLLSGVFSYELAAGERLWKITEQITGTFDPTIRCGGEHGRPAG